MDPAPSSGGTKRVGDLGDLGRTWALDSCDRELSCTLSCTERWSDRLEPSTAFSTTCCSSINPFPLTSSRKDGCPDDWSLLESFGCDATSFFERLVGCDRFSEVDTEDSRGSDALGWWDRRTMCVRGGRVASSNSRPLQKSEPMLAKQPAQ